MGLRKRRRSQGDRKRNDNKKKRCKLCGKKIESIDYKDVEMLKHFLTDRAKIVPRRTSGNCARHQRMLAVAIRRARTVAMLPYVVD